VRSAPAASAPQLRIARPSRDLAAVTRFYTRGLGLQVLATFSDHEGIDGVVLGHPAWPYHLEFTRRRRDPVTPAATDEDLLVLYFPDRSEWSAAVQRLHDTGARTVRAANPYWHAHGVTFEDPDAYRLVLQNTPWPEPRPGALAATGPAHER
jgi:catechol 2,3-dioxygenase-like lactoylglutathione lyase family enzyme